jgi:hypothetical protein
MYRNKSQTQGFTIIELMLAMTFLSFVLVFMSLTIVQMMRTYDKGLTIKQVNQAGRAVTDDIAKAMRGEQPGNIVVTNVANGRLCIGNVMYIWNPVYVGSRTAPTASTTDNYRIGGAPLTMARQYLANPTATCNTPNLINYNITPSQTDYSILGGRARVLWAGVTNSPDGRLVKLTFIMGTYDLTEAANIRTGAYAQVFNTAYFSSGNPTCQPGSNGNYCAFVEFSSIVYLPNGQ